MDQQLNNVQQQIYQPLVPPMSEMIPSPMYAPYTPNYNLPGNMNYFNANNKLFNNPYPYHHNHQMSQPSYGIPRSPSYSYASSASSSPSCSSESNYGLPAPQQSPTHQISPSTSPYSGLHPHYPKIFVENPTSSTSTSTSASTSSTSVMNNRRVVRCSCSFCATGRDVKNNKGQRLHACDWAGCGKIYPKTSHLKAHIRTHTNNRPFVCRWENCFKSFSRSDELNRHARIHSGIKTHICQSCGKGFTRSDHLQKHKKTHENQKRRKAKKEGAATAEVTSADVPAAPRQEKENAPIASAVPALVSQSYVPAPPQQYTSQLPMLHQPPAMQNHLEEQYSVQQQQQHQQQQQQQPLMQLQFTCVTYPNNFYHY